LENEKMDKKPIWWSGRQESDVQADVEKDREGSGKEGKSQPPTAKAGGHVAKANGRESKRKNRGGERGNFSRD
jgi:hypothetical protein